MKKYREEYNDSINNWYIEKDEWEVEKIDFDEIDKVFEITYTFTIKNSYSENSRCEEMEYDVPFRSIRYDVCSDPKLSRMMFDFCGRTPNDSNIDNWLKKFFSSEEYWEDIDGIGFYADEFFGKLYADQAMLQYSKDTGMEIK